MDFASIVNRSEPHQRTIVHLDMDCFYAQVEEVRDPTLRNRPLGIQQKNCVVTCNYVARQYGVEKLMAVTDAQRLCPELVLVNGEDLTPYRQMSQRIFELLLTFTPLVEKLGFDENFMDVTDLVTIRLRQLQGSNPNGREHNFGDRIDRDLPMSSYTQIEGNIYPTNGTLTACECGCAQRLTIGTHIAQEIRTALYTQLNMTCCAGVSYNKLLAKLVGSQQKPNKQTVLVSTYAEQFMRDLCNLNRVTGIGQKTESLLLENGIANITELQQCDMDFLRKKFGFETATKLRDLAFGRDTSAVRPTGKPKSISLEDSCRPISVRTDVEERFRMLLLRLLEQVAEDGRIPIAIKVVLRKFDAQKKTSHRETKQANILPSLFKSSVNADAGTAKVLLADGAQEKLLKIIMRLFERVVDLSKPFNITLIGLAFSKFQQRKIGSSSIANFLIKKTDLEVQSVTSLTNTDVVETISENTPSSNNDEAFRSSPTTFQPSDQFYRRRTTAASPIPMLVDNGSESGATNSDFSDFSETEVEPSPKKSRIGRMLMTKRRCLGSKAVCSSTDGADVASPSKLRVCDLRLNSRDSEKDFPLNPATTNNIAIASASNINVSVPALRYRAVQPPSALFTRSDRMTVGHRQTTVRQTSLASSASTSPLPSPMDDSVSSAGTPSVDYPTIANEDETNISSLNDISDIISSTSEETGNLTNIPCPAGVDAAVFNELPLDVQNELIASWRSSLAAAAVAVANGNVSGAAADSPGSGNSHQSSSTATAKAGGATSTSSGAQKNTLYRYFLRNK